MFRALLAIFGFITYQTTAVGELISLPPRVALADGGTEFAAKVAKLDLATRDQKVISEVLSGNVPEFWRQFVDVHFERQLGDRMGSITYRVAPDYLAIGSNDDFLLMPMMPRTAQSIADRLDCILPTRRMVDAIYASASVQMAPAPVPATPEMTSVTAFLDHQRIIASQRASFLRVHPWGSLVAGHKKDVVITSQLAADATRVAIYGWHLPGGAPIQPLYAKHSAQWVDYSHGIRLVQRKMLVNGRKMDAVAVLADPELCVLLSDEGVIQNSEYRGSQLLTSKAISDNARWGEKTEVLSFLPDIRVIINSPADIEIGSGKPIKLILYALPNGSSIEETMGKVAGAREDTRFEIQHIAAQVRWLRAHIPDERIVVAYAETAEKSWPAWRRKNDRNDERVQQIVEDLLSRYSSGKVELVLSGHSGGGSFIFGFINGAGQIPAAVKRIAFLDGNYAYDPGGGHIAKLTEWLKGGTDRHLVVTAYDDSLALLNRRPFVSAEGGTWGRSFAMLRDLSSAFSFGSADTPDLLRRTALDGRVQFLLRENPTRTILHTRLVELNGFIQAMLSGTAMEGQGYEFLGPRAYSEFISAD